MDLNKRRFSVRSPEELFEAVFPPRAGETRRLCRCALLSALLSALAAYHLLVIVGHGNADAVCEGLVSYTGSDWALACGRWAIRYMEAASGEVIVPGLWLALYAVCCALSTLLLAKLWGIESLVAVCLTACLLTVNPTVIEQSLLQYMFMAWGVSNLLAVLFVYLCCAEGSWPRRYILAPLCMAVAFGLYQSCVSLMCVCFCMTLILRLFRGESLKDTLLLVFRFALSAFIGTALYFLILRVETLRYAVAESERVAIFSLRGFLSSLPVSVPQAYKTYLAYFADYRFHRLHIYALLVLLGALCSGAALLRLAKGRHILEALFALLLLALIPFFSNVADVIFPYNEPVLIMQYQSMLIVPFLLGLPFPAFLEGKSAGGLLRHIAPILLCCLLWGYVVAANATYRVYDLSYRHLNFVTASAMNDVYEMEDYTPDDVIAFAGFPDDDLLRASVPAYRQAYGQYDSFVFWDGMMGLQYCRRNYLLNYFGIDAGHIYGHLYNDAVHSDEFREMPVWPAQDSVKRINSLVIVKFSDDPPIFD